MPFNVTMLTTSRQFCWVLEHVLEERIEYEVGEVGVGAVGVGDAV